MMLSPNERALLLTALKASDDSLFQILGEDANRVSLGIAPHDPSALIEVGKHRLRSIFIDLRFQLCSSPFRKALHHADASDDRRALLAILDIVLTQYGFLPAVSVTVLLSRGLLEKWCRDESGVPDV
jgi:hypothetical protein